MRPWPHILLLSCWLNATPPAVVTHGGVGGDPLRTLDGTDRAAHCGLETLKTGTALEAVLAAVAVLEDDPRFNAGTGANIRLDGRTVQMDAAVMEGATGSFGAVAAIERVKNPVRVARKVMESPHLLIVGEGATRFARAMGFPDYDPICPESRARFRRLKGMLVSQGTRPEAWKRYDWKQGWNFPTPIKEALGTPDTVGAVARDAQGRFAAAISTGGTTITFYGRVGDVPIYGAGIFAGPKGAVACTGHGEEIVKRLVAKAVYDRLDRGERAQAAVEATLQAFPATVDLGVIAIDAEGEGGGCNLGTGPLRSRRMAWSAERAAP